MTVETGDQPAPASGRHPQRPRRRTLRWVLLAMLVLVVTTAVCAVVMLRDALTAQDALEDAASSIPAVETSLRESLVEGSDQPVADAPELRELQDSTRAAREATDGLLWDLASHLPAIGASVAAVQTVAAALDEVAADVLPALAATGDAATATERTEDGGFDLAPLASVADDVTAAGTALDDARADLAGIDRTEIRRELVEPLDTLDQRLEELADLVTGAQRVTTLLPAMLGADEPREYLLLGMNSAELRTAGGIPGALTLLGVDDGAITIEDQASSQDVGPFRESVVALDPQDEEAYSARLGRFVQDVTLTPDFATTGPIAAEMWSQAQGGQVDGVIATDPVALSFLLEATGPVQVPLPEEAAEAVGSDTLEVRAETVVDLLLRSVYDSVDPEVADDLFAAVASAVFSELTTGDVHPGAVLPALERAARQHRLLVWSAREDEQELLAGTLLAGTFGADRAADAVGVFLDDTRVGKMTAYLGVELDLASSECTTDGRLDTVEVTLTNELDPDAAADLPAYVAGPEDEPGREDIVVNVTAAGVRDGAVPALARDGAPVGGATRTVHDRENVVISVTLQPGESTTLDIGFPASPEAARGEGAGAPGTLEVWSTPTAGTRGLHVLEASVCG